MECLRSWDVGRYLVVLAICSDFGAGFSIRRVSINADLASCAPFSSVHQYHQYTISLNHIKTCTCTAVKYVCISYASNLKLSPPFPLSTRTSSTIFVIFDIVKFTHHPRPSSQTAYFPIKCLQPFHLSCARHEDPLDRSGEVALLCQPGVVLPPFPLVPFFCSFSFPGGATPIFPKSLVKSSTLD